MKKETKVRQNMFRNIDNRKRRPMRPGGIKPVKPILSPEPDTRWWPSLSQQALNQMCGPGGFFDQQVGRCQQDDY
tara:strand:- start:214 stop:438 length:225 start_codon:yes stop_codon:yes gene_type:complete